MKRLDSRACLLGDPSGESVGAQPEQSLSFSLGTTRQSHKNEAALLAKESNQPGKAASREKGGGIPVVRTVEWKFPIPLPQTGKDSTGVWSMLGPVCNLSLEIVAFEGLLGRQKGCILGRDGEPLGLSLSKRRKTLNLTLLACKLPSQTKEEQFVIFIHLKKNTVQLRAVLCITKRNIKYCSGKLKNESEHLELG